MAGRRHTRGILSRLGKADVKSKPRRRSPLRSALRWVVFTIAMAFLLLLIAGALSGLFVPDLGTRREEATVRVIEVQDGAAGLPAAGRFVAAAIVDIEGKRVRVGLTRERLDGVAAGRALRVKYSYSSASGGVRVDEWTLMPEP